MLVVTSNDIPGWEIRQVCGEVFGLTVRSRNAFSQMGAGFKSLVGGELKGMTANLVITTAKKDGVLLVPTTALLPNKGLPLPFISYGGSNLVFCLLGVGILINIYRQGLNEKDEQNSSVTMRARTRNARRVVRL